MNGHTWTIADGTVILISKMEDEHLINSAKMIQKRHRDSCNWGHLTALYKLVLEIEYRGLDEYGEWDGMTIGSIKQAMVENGIPIPGKQDGNITTLTPNQSPLEKINDDYMKRRREIQDKEWQEMEAQMLPEGDRQILILEQFYVPVHNITRRIVPNIGSALPPFYISKRSNHYKKCRITIEVLED